MSININVHRHFQDIILIFYLGLVNVQVGRAQHMKKRDTFFSHSRNSAHVCLFQRISYNDICLYISIIASNDIVIEINECDVIQAIPRLEH